MADEKTKKAMPLLSAQAVARVKEQGAGDWGADEHLAGMRYLVAACQAQVAQWQKSPPADKALVLDLNALLRKEFSEWPAWAYASNMQKRLVELGEFKTGTYE